MIEHEEAVAIAERLHLKGVSAGGSPFRDGCLVKGHALGQGEVELQGSHGGAFREAHHQCCLFVHLCLNVLHREALGVGTDNQRCQCHDDCIKSFHKQFLYYQSKNVAIFLFNIFLFYLNNFVFITVF